MSVYISKYVSYREVIHSNTAIKRGIPNFPSNQQLNRIKLLSQKVFDPLRIWCGGKVKINSLFRSLRLNKLIGGVKSSQHRANRGAAMDIDDTFGNKTNLEMFLYIKDNLVFDQLIAEFGDKDGNPRWVHVSYNELNNRGVVLISYHKYNSTKGKYETKYAPYVGNEYLLTENF